MSDITLLSLSTSPWEYPYWTSRQFLMYELANFARVIYATDREDIREALTPSTIAGRLSAAPFAAPSGLELLKSRWPRIHRYRGLDRAFKSAYVRRLQKRLDLNSNARRVVYAWNPSCLEIVTSLSYDMLIYHPYDMFRHFVDPPVGLVQQENEMCCLADSVVTPHGSIAEALEHPNTNVISNGVFLPAFPDKQNIKQPQVLKEIEGTIIGNLGVINDKIDFRLLLELFSARPDWQMVFLGFEGAGLWKQSSSYKEMENLKNVHFLGAVPINNVAQIIAWFDIGVIPYSLSSWARFIESPLKLYQYWAMGLPVVSSPLPTLQSQPGALEICRSAEDWHAGIERQLALRNTELQKTLRAKAEEHGWAGKAEQVMRIIHENS